MMVRMTWGGHRESSHERGEAHQENRWEARVCPALGSWTAQA
jgi:hypothetical protein